MTLPEIAKILTGAGIEDGKFEAGLLISYFTGVSRAAMLADPNREYDSPGLAEAVEKRARRYPLQYILGTWEFMGLPFTVNENCLIPRPDTECVTEAAISALPDGGRVLDLCTGSGCIIAAVLHYTKNTAGCAVELFPGTADLARKNIEALGLSRRCTVITGDAAEDLFPETEKFHVIVSNPPYIAKDEMETLAPELDHEPRAALTDEKDGLTLIEPIIRIYRNRLTEDGALILEHGWQQSDAVRAIAEKYGMSFDVIRDLGGNIRGAMMRRKRLKE